MRAYFVIIRRDLRLAFRRFSEVANPLIFFAIVTALFPLALSPSAAQLQAMGTGVVWVGALLSSLLSLDALFRNDVDDGSMEQLLLSPVPFGITVLGKLTAHWIISGIPLIVLVPVVALSFYLPLPAVGTLTVALLLATPTITVLVAIGAALTVSLRSGASIIGLLVLPLCSPLLIFGTRATDLALKGDSVAGPLYLLASLAVLALTLGPLAIAAALKVGLE
jgi:heme exporter protein B